MYYKKTIQKSKLYSINSLGNVRHTFFYDWSDACVSIYNMVDDYYYIMLLNLRGYYFQK